MASQRTALRIPNNTTEVKEHRLSKIQNVQNWIFGVIYDRSLLYNTCWEDPALDRVALDIGPGDRMAVITSAGCNVLDYALKEPTAVHAIDANPRQTALLELKIAAIKRLDYETFYALFGKGRCPHFRDLYRGTLRNELSTPTRAFWDDRLQWFDPLGPSGGFYYRGLSGLMARIFRAHVRAHPRLQRGLQRLLVSETLDEQRDVYARLVEPHLFTRSFKWLLDRQAIMNLVGVPASQREEVKREVGAGVSVFVQQVLRQVCFELPIRDNYHWTVYIRGHYTPHCCPEYLKPNEFQRLKAGLVETIVPHTQTLTQFFESTPDKISKFVLLDHMDWMAWHDPKGLNEEWSAIMRCATDDARIIFRSGASQPGYLESVRAETPSGQQSLDDLLDWKPELAKELHVKDRVGTYAGFHIAHRKPAMNGNG